MRVCTVYEWWKWGLLVSVALRNDMVSLYIRIHFDFIGFFHYICYFITCVATPHHHHSIYRHIFIESCLLKRDFSLYFIALYCMLYHGIDRQFHVFFAYFLLFWVCLFISLRFLFSLNGFLSLFLNVFNSKIV